jgi:hypothetical protein
VAIKDNENPEIAFSATFPDGEVIQYNDLCDRCSKTVENVKVELKEWDREIKYAVVELGPKVQGDQAAPLSPAPNYSPPQPHSAAAAKR